MNELLIFFKDNSDYFYNINKQNAGNMKVFETNIEDRNMSMVSLLDFIKSTERNLKNTMLNDPNADTGTGIDSIQDAPAATSLSADSDDNNVSNTSLPKNVKDSPSTTDTATTADNNTAATTADNNTTATSAVDTGATNSQNSQNNNSQNSTNVSSDTTTASNTSTATARYRYKLNNRIFNSNSNQIKRNRPNFGHYDYNDTFDKFKHIQESFGP